MQKLGATASMSIFLKQEIDRIQIVIKLVNTVLKDLLLAIEGVIIMSEVTFPLMFVHRNKTDAYKFI